MVYAWPIIPKTGMINFCEALVVGSLYQFSRIPEETVVIGEVADDLHRFTEYIENQKLIFASDALNDKIICYSNITKRPIEKNTAMNLLALEKTADILIFDRDLLYGDRYAANELDYVIENAKSIINNNPSILSACSSSRANPTPSDQTAINFPTETASTPVPVHSKKRNKLRTNTMDPAIDKAIEQAGCSTLAPVYLKLRELALAEESPFTGIIEADALCYTDDNGQPAKLTKNALGQRLKRR